MGCGLCTDGIKKIVGDRGWETIPCWCPAGRAIAEAQRQEKVTNIAAEREILRQSNK